MTRFRFAAPFIAGIALAAAILAPGSASARTPFDGAWSVLIITRSGPCDSAYRYRLSIRNGAVSVRVWAGRQGASGSGRLGRSSGGGIWRGTGSMGTCSGVWSAERR